MLRTLTPILLALPIPWLRYTPATELARLSVPRTAAQ
jgi:hypothetical protein